MNKYQAHQKLKQLTMETINSYNKKNKFTEASTITTPGTNTANQLGTNTGSQKDNTSD